MNRLKQFLFRRFRAHETKIHELNYLFWECTQRCNLSCLHCGSDCSSGAEFADMPAADFLSALDTIPPSHEPVMVVITGGEPLLRRDLEDCGREIRKRKMRWGIVSNGYNYTQERHSSLLAAGMGALTISLDGLEEQHNWLRNTKKDFSRVCNAIKIAAASKRLNFDVVTCVNKKNIGSLSEIAEMLHSLGVKSWRLFTIAPIGRAAVNPDLLLTADEMQHLMEFIAKKRISTKTDIKFSCEGYTGRYEGKVRDGHFFCRAGINIASVLVDGSISACPNIDRSFVQGSIYTDNLYKVWNQRFQPFRNRAWTKTGMCLKCKHYINCAGSGMHLWHGNKDEILICHNHLIELSAEKI